MESTNELTQLKYDSIINRIRNTMKAYSICSIELGLLNLEFKGYISSCENLPHIEKLNNVCNFLGEHSSSSYLIQAIYFEAIKDLNALKMNSNIDTTQLIYWE